LVPVAEKSISDLSGFAFSIGLPATETATSGRPFPITAQVDVQSGLEDLLHNRSGTTLLGTFSPD
jgi:hypothetical protein